MTNPEIEQREILIDEVDPGKRYRENMDADALQDLMESIAEYGVMQPISVVDKEMLDDSEVQGELDPDKRYLLITGGRRLYASQGLEMKKIPAVIRDEKVDAEAYREMELFENLHREDLDWEEEAQLKKRLHDLRVDQEGEKHHSGDDGQSVRDTAEELGESPATTSQDIQLAEALDDPELNEVINDAKNKSDARKKLKKHEEKKEMEKKAKQARSESASTPLDKKRKKLEESYRNEDFFEFASQIPDNSIDFVELDPPFAIDLQNLVSEGQTQSTTTERITAEEYDDIDPDDYAPFMRDTLEEVERVMKDHAWGICWFAMDPWFEYIYNWLNERDFFVKKVPALWIKPNGRNRNVNYLLSNGYEQFFYFRKGTPAIRDKGRLNYYDFPLPKKSKRIHPAERPIELYEEILETFTLPGEDILSPYLGSGNIILAGANRNSRVIGCDLNEDYYNPYVNKVYNGEPGEYSSY